MSRTLTCVPRSVCSKDYRVQGAPEGEAEVFFDHLTEQGHVSLAGYRLRVRKHGPTSGRWTLEHEGRVLAEGRKPSAWTRRFEIDTPAGTSLEGTVHLKARSSMTRVFDLEHEGRRLGEIRPQHAFTRRALIACDPRVDTITQLFAFWLVALSWRRQAASAAAGGG